MKLEVGKIQKIRFNLFKNLYMFECGENGMVLEREKKMVTLYATNGECNRIFCEIPLGDSKELQKRTYVAISYSPDKMLLDAGEILVVVDFAEKKVAVNKPEISVCGKNDWGQDVQRPWRGAYNVMFGLPAGDLEMDRDAAAAFWNWFEEGQATIVERISAGGEDAQEMIWVINRWLAPVFPYEKETELEFQLGCNADGNEFFMYHFNKEQLKADAEELGEMMPESLRRNWTYTTEA